MPDNKEWRPDNWEPEFDTSPYLGKVSTCPDPDLMFTERDGTMLGGKYVNFVNVEKLVKDCFEAGASAMLKARKQYEGHKRMIEDIIWEARGIPSEYHVFVKGYEVYITKDYRDMCLFIAQLRLVKDA